MHLDPISLRLFIAVVETGTIAAASQREHIAPSAISKRISELESLLNTRLLKRNNRGIEVTPAGENLAQMARSILHQMDEVYRQMQEYSHGLRGEVRIVANISAITQFLPAQLKAFLDEHPLVQIHLEERISSEIVEAVASNQADIGIFTETLESSPELEIYPYRSDQLVLIIPPTHPLVRVRSIQFVDTLQYDYVGLHTGSAINNRLLQAASSAGAPCRIRIQVTSYEALARMVEEGLGIGIMPRDIAHPYIKTGRLRAVELKDSWARRHLKVCINSRQMISQATERLLNHLSPDLCV